MNIILFGAYISSIFIYILVILIIFFAWREYFPRKILFLLIITFISSTLGLFILLISEMTAPYSGEFYLNPYLYLIYLTLVGCAMYTIYLLVLETQFKHVRFLSILGYIIFAGVFIYFLLSIIYLSLPLLQDYFWYIQDLLIADAFGIGFVAYILLGIGCFRDSRSDRLEWEHRRGFILIGIYSLLISYGLSLLIWGLIFTDFSIAPNPLASAFWLVWIDIVVILFLFIVKRAMKIVTN